MYETLQYAFCFTFLATESHTLNSQGLILYFSDEQFSLKVLNSDYKACDIWNNTGGSFSPHYVHSLAVC